jgi:DNA polymerase III subunit epsilon
MSHWSDRLVVFDTETTGLDTRFARIVTAYVGVIDENGVPLEGHDWLADPGVAIPDAAAAVHGVTTEIAQRDGRRAIDVITEIGEVIADYLAQGLPIVAYNATYDFSILHHESVRYGLLPLQDPKPIIDPLVIDRAVDKFRKGKRTLSMAAAHYLVPLDDSHTADQDAIAAGRVAQAIIRSHEELVSADPLALHEQQKVWSSEWAASYQKFRQSRGEAGFSASSAWPVQA